jgi:hypothetical protein
MKTRGTPFRLGLSCMSSITERAYSIMINNTSSTVEDDFNLFLLDIVD